MGVRGPLKKKKKKKKNNIRYERAQQVKEEEKKREKMPKIHEKGESERQAPEAYRKARESGRPYARY